MGIVFDIKKYAIHDGPGIRTTVFLKGCPLRCAWCHNPESWRTQPELGVRATRCVRCGACVQACPNDHAVIPGENIPSSRCTLCGSCLSVCPSGARQIIGSEMSVSDVVKEIEKDLIFYDESGGGATFSGGEPLMQGEFLNQCLKQLTARDIHTAVDTTCYADPELIKEVAAHTDLFLCDIKHTDPARHREFTGVDNKLILSNIEMLANMGKRLVIRVPVVPGFNADDTNIETTARFVSGLGSVRRVDILPYNLGGVEKARRLTQSEGIKRFELPQDADMSKILNIFASFGLEAKAGG